MDEQFRNRLSEHAEAVTRFLDKAISPDEIRQGEISRPAQLIAAMRYATLNGGKRLRPFVTIESAALFGVSEAAAMPTAAALECIHCYSLVHDDLPAMDDDDLRRGKPTVHRKWDEATAILAGDSLLTFAFDLVTAPCDGVDETVRCKLASHLARAAGPGGMAGGQMLDLQAEDGDPGMKEVLTLQSMKTGALIRFAAEAGAILGKASPGEQEILSRYGRLAGQAFQLADDILDVTATTEQMGKKTGKDGEAGKGTLVSLLGLDEARRRLDGLVEEAVAILEPFGDRSNVLKATARFFAGRDS